MIEFTCQQCGKRDTVAITVYPSALGIIPHKMAICCACYDYFHTQLMEIYERKMSDDQT